MVKGLKEPCHHVWAPIELSYFTAVLSAILCLITILGNSLVCFIIYKDPHKKLQTPFMYFLVSLTISDLLVGCITMPTSVITHTLEATKEKSKSHTLTIRLSYLISANASLLNLSVLCLDRYIAVSYPTKYRNLMTFTRFSLTSVFIWMLSFSFPMLMFYVGYIEYLMIFVNTEVILTLAILFFTYLKIYTVLKEQTGKLKPNLRLSEGAKEEVRLNVSKEKLASRKTEKRITKAFLILLEVFSALYVPVFIIIYVLMFCPKCDCKLRHVLRDVHLLFTVSNSAVNPFICSIRLKPFREAIKTIFKLENNSNSKYSMDTASNISQKMQTQSLLHD